ncbi:M56 family metallopeptidase [Hymenobacter setariae]|nr:M56 family metallopeptidase [Hymenobacter setariae]
MTTPQVLREVLSPALVRGVGYALLHSLWQGGALAVLLAGVLPLLRRHRAEVRYAVSAGALATLVLAVGLTFNFYYQSQPATTGQWVAASPVASNAVLAADATAATNLAAPAAASQLAPLAWLQANARNLEPYLPAVVGVWLLGLLLMSGRLAGGLVYTNRLRRAGTQALGAEWQQRLAALARRAGVRQPVALLESARVAGPLVLGHLRPAILLPLGAVAGLSPALLEALLAHELAHIVRRDYLLNLGLAVVEVLFFYHPAVWFMAGCLRAERENCCDDQAAALCGGDRLRVARALAALAELEAAPATAPRLALAATGTGGRGSLLARVRRLALGRPQAPTLGEGLLALLLGVVGVAGLSTGVALAAPAGNRVVKALVTTGKQALAPADTTQKVPVVMAGPAADASDLREEVVSTPAVVAAPRVRMATTLQGRPPRRDRASTVVIEKDKKGRIVNLLVNGQPVETDASGKKAKRDKKEKVRTVEVVRVPNETVRVERLERPRARTYSFNMSPDRANEMAQFGLAEALNNQELTTEQREQMERELGRLKAQGKALEGLTVEPRQELRLNLNGLAYNLGNGLAYNPEKWRDAQRRMQEGQQRLRDGQRRFLKAQRQFELLDLTGRADRDAAQADREAARADREAEQADRANDRTELAARRAELRARIAADAAELRALERSSARQPLTQVPAPPRPPRAPRSVAPAAPVPPAAPGAPGAPGAPNAPLPPAPPTAPNTIKLREALRNDGLIQDDKHFSFNLNDQGGRVNGKALTPEQATKYRQLLNLPTTKIKGSKTNFGITVDEN